MTFVRGSLLAGGVVAPIVFAACAVAAGIGVAGYSATADHLSGLAAVPAERRGLMVAGFVVLGAGVTLVGVAIARVEDSRLVPLALAVGGAAILLLGLLPRDCVEVACTDPSWHHRAHDVASVPAYLLAVALPGVVAWRSSRLPTSPRLAIGVMAMTASLIALFAAGPSDSIGGLLQRLALVPPLAWMVVVSGRWARTISPENPW